MSDVKTKILKKANKQKSTHSREKTIAMNSLRDDFGTQNSENEI